MYLPNATNLKFILFEMVSIIQNNGWNILGPDISKY